MEKELQNRISKEIERLNNEDLIPAETNANNLNDRRIRQMAQRFADYREVLNNALNNNSTDEIISYANDIFSHINWSSTEITDFDNAIDSLRILVYIMNLLNPNRIRTNFNTIEHTLTNAREVINNINNTRG